MPARSGRGPGATPATACYARLPTSRPIAQRTPYDRWTAPGAPVLWSPSGGARSMEFGLFYEIPVARPWGPRSEHDAYRPVVEQAVLGEQVGFHSFWTVEHHFLEELSHCSAPEVLYGTIAPKTSRIRIGHGVRLLPFPYNHPVRAAESAAVLDLLSDGRLEFGTGRSSTRAELEGFGIDPQRTRELWEEALDVVVAAWTNDVFEWNGKQFHIPPRRLLPKPLQRPHPPLGGATSSPDSNRVMGETGIGRLSSQIGTPP